MSDGVGIVICAMLGMQVGLTFVLGLRIYSVLLDIKYRR